MAAEATKADQAAAAAEAAAAEAAAEAEVKSLSPRDRKILEDVLAQHPELTIAEALAHLKEAGM